MNPTKLLAAALALCAFGAFGANEPLLSIGVARIDITPKEPVRLHGYGGRRANSEGVAQHLFAKALAFGTDREGASVFLTVDNLAVPGAVTDEVAARLKKRGIKREQIGLCSSHTHSAPMLTGAAPNIFSSDIIPEQQAAIDRYTQELVDNLERVALAALSNRAPSKLSWNEGRVTFAKNRRVIREGRAQFGDNDTAPVDHALATMFVHGADGKLRAVLVNYACHCTTLGSEWNQIHGDWSGFAQEALERDHPGAIGLVSIGCGADANPSPRGQLEQARAYGNEIATEVRRLLALEGQAPRVPDQNDEKSGTRGTRPSRAITKLPDGKLKRFNLDFDPLPTRAQWDERAKKPGIVGYHAKKNLARLDRGEKLPTKLPYSVQTWTFDDDLAMVFLPGEVVIDYQRRLKREFDDTRLWVNAYANDVPCYIPSRRILAEGGYEAEDSLWYYDRPARLATSSEDRIIKAVHDLLPRKFVAKADRAEGGSARAASAGTPSASPPTPLSPKQALNSMHVAPEFVVDLVAAEPLVVDPVAIDWGADGKLWVAEMRDYPMGIDGKWKPGGVVKFLEDRNGDGHYDKATLFLDNLPFPTGVFAWRKGVLICAAPDIIYAEDTNGDGRADVVRKVFTGFETNNYQARVNSLALGLDGWVYGANGLLGGKIEGRSTTLSLSPQRGEGRGEGWERSGALDAKKALAATTPHPNPLPVEGRGNQSNAAINIRGRDFRMNPDTGAFEPASGLTQQGRVRDDFGNWFGCDNSRSLWHYPLADEYVRRNPHVAAPNPAVHVPQGRDWNRVFPASTTLERFNDASHANRITSACGLEIYRDELLGKEFYGNAFVCEPVHNLVHRQVLAPHGVTFRSTRATNEMNREFLSSTDNWFRPAQARTGPDGALWVVDMYRHVIEHPRWIPSNRLAQLDVRAGADKGRIYRVYRKDTPPRRMQNFAKLSTEQLAAKLESPNGTERDIVHRELLHRGDLRAISKLLDLSTNSARPAVRVQCLAALGSLGGLTQQFLETAFQNEKSPSVRRQIIQLSDQWPADFLADTALGRDERLRFQAVLSVSKTNSKPVWLVSHGQLWGEATTNAWMRAAVLSAMDGNSARQVLPMAWPYAERAHNFTLADGLFATMLAEQPLLTTSVTLLPASRSEATEWRLRNSRAVLDTWRKKLAAGWPDEPEKLEERQQNFDTLRHRMSQLCRRILSEPDAPKALRLEAVRLLALVNIEKSDRAVLDAALSDDALRDAAIDGLIAGDALDVPDFLIPHWREFTPGQREKILSGFVTRAPWSDALLVAAQNGIIVPAEISLLVRNQLLTSKDAALRERAEGLWPKRQSNRAKVIADYRQAITSSGDALAGREIFNQNCATCHQLAGKGTAVGPDLTPWRDKSTEDFLVALLDPNAAIEPRYVNYIVPTKRGGVFYGVIRSETATSIELAAPGIHETVLRSDIASIQAVPTSLMPEGLEQNITPAQMNDLIAYLKQPGPRPFGSATREQVAAARAEFMAQRPTGRARLIAASEKLDYPSWLGRLPLWHCRQTDGKSHVVWEAPLPPPGNGMAEFVVPVAIGFASQPPGVFALKVNGKAALEFNVALNDADWASADGSVQVAYRVLEANSEDSNGLLHLRLARELMQGVPVKFEVVGAAANSQRWFGVYDTKLIAHPQAQSSAR
ncbi:MAG TPA: neutral/alkaline non-lysosomal ceramidase N-terminal domain-containing protein [Methylomirabilota bacterium]|nr:neutral/alkaline non-lysosomal ceramidase N-terminal domain-containing protein [Methylomirabilota bacterium]